MRGNVQARRKIMHGDEDVAATPADEVRKIQETSVINLNQPRNSPTKFRCALFASKKATAIVSVGNGRETKFFPEMSRYVSG